MPASNSVIREQFFCSVLNVCNQFLDKLTGAEMIYELNLIKHKIREHYGMKNKDNRPKGGN
jgi:hypothetical protein